MKHQWRNDDAAFGMPDLTYCAVCNTVENLSNINEDCPGPKQTVDVSDLIYRLRRRAEIRRQIPDRKSVQEGKPDRIANILEEAAQALEYYQKKFG